MKEKRRSQKLGNNVPKSRGTGERRGTTFPKAGEQGNNVPQSGGTPIFRVFFVVVVLHTKHSYNIHRHRQEFVFIVYVIERLFQQHIVFKTIPVATINTAIRNLGKKLAMNILNILDCFKL